MAGPAAQPGALERERFAELLARATGLDLGVVRAWLRAENGQRGRFNFLGVRTGTRGRGYSGVPLAGHDSGGFAAFRSLEDAVRESAHWINQMGNYAGIRNAVGRGPRAQLDAIANSPWDAGHYHNGASLRGAYETVTSNLPERVGGAAGDLAGDVAGAVSDPIVGAVEGVAQFAFDKAVLALGYVVLTGAGVALFVMGLNRVSGSAGGPTVQGAVRTVAGAATRGRGSDIPF